MWLSREQLESLTGKKRPSAQIRVLIDSGIRFRVVAGRPIVTEAAIDGSEKKVRRVPQVS
jgi:hypothetical protein